MRIIAVLILLVSAVWIWQGWPEVDAYMAADAVTKSDYLIAKMNRQPFEFPTRE